jgi:phosphate transport system protein
MSLHLQRQIDRLKKLVLSLGAMVEESVHQAIEAVQKRDPAMARQVIEGDARIDQMEIDVEEECLHTLALHQPVAFDIRYVVAVLKINNDLERIGDLAVNIAEQAVFLAEEARLETLPFDATTMADRARTMLKQAMDALVQIDPDLADGMRGTDDEVDALHRQAYQNIAAAIRDNPQYTDQYINLLNLSRHLERIADHAVNIAEDVIYMARGDILRHERPHPLKEQGT